MANFKVNGKFNFHGGDVQGYSIDKLPAGAKRIDPKPVAYGETSGHVHVLTGDVELFELDGQTFAAVGKDGAYHQHMHESQLTADTYKVNRNISSADHTKECRIEPGVYALGIDQAYDPFENVWRKSLD